MGVRLYLKDNTDGKIHEYGSNLHDSLILQEDGSLHYKNLQNCAGTEFPEEGYSFVLPNGDDPRKCEEYIRHGVERYIDIGGDGAGRGCGRCKWRHRYQKCACCRRNPNIKDCFTEDEELAERLRKAVFE